MSDDTLFPNPNGEQTSLDTSGGGSTQPAQKAPGQKLTKEEARARRQAELIASLDEPQHFEDASSFQIRGELQELVQRDLLGPWEGETESLPPRSSGPRERYLVGMLGPRHQPPKSSRDAADEVMDNDNGAAGDSKGENAGELQHVSTPQNLGHLWASTMGLAFSVPADVTAVHVTTTWGQYDKSSSLDEEGRPTSVWSREPKEYPREVRLDEATDFKVGLTDPDPGVPSVYLNVTVRPRDGRRTVEITLVNNREPVTPNGDSKWLFQAQLAVTALDGHSPVFLPVDDPLEDTEPVTDDYEDLHLRLLYRDQLKYADGRNIAVNAEVTPDARRAHRLYTTWLPHHDVPATTADVGEGSKLAGIELSMDALATIEPDALRTGLAPLADGYAAWLAEREAGIADLPEALRETATTAVFKAKEAARRIRAGIDLLTDPAYPRHEEALKAFRFANRTMADQRRHTQISQLREDPTTSYADAERQVRERGVEAASWRPFQLAFVLLNLPSITDPDHEERAASASATVDLLFFPTGGGKTEAYLGLTAYTFAIRRLQGIVGAGQDARSGLAGVAVLMRYTLRLLTAQQFQRAAALVCAAELVRREDPGTWGEEPFRIGLWVGGGVSPNWFDEAEKQIREAREAGKGERANVLQTLTCPWCGTALKAHQNLEARPETRRVLLHCANAEGANAEGTDACPFSRKASAEGLPILTVDEEIYRYAPSLVIATVDKLAQLPWRGYAGMLFGRVAEHCPRHGFRHTDLDAKTGCASRHNSKGRLPKVESRPVPRLRPPDLIIQDELHLISGALGTTVGLFESAVDELTSWTTPSGKRTAPKIVASTATTKRAEDQVLGVFGRSLQIFPPQVTEVTDTFFSAQVPITEKDPGRRYMGVCAHGVRIKLAEIRLAEILMLAGQQMFDTYGAPADPYMTMVGYFNATRELAGMRRYMDDDITVRVRKHARSKGLAERLTPTGMFTVQELTSRISSADISEVLKLLEQGFDPEIDTSGRRKATGAQMSAFIKANGRSSADQVILHPATARRRERNAPVDAVLATSMLQVGVDVSRFGLMVVTGQPKNTAEYIQASSRVGRDAARPGLVVTLYNWTRPRDLAHYEDFGYYHATFYRQVEALSVTPFTRRSLDRGTAATFVAAVRNATQRHSHNADAHDVDLDGPEVAEVVARMLERAERVDGQRGREYLAERIKALVDTWKSGKEGSTRLGYERSTEAKQQLRGLLRKPGEGPWSGTTVGMSMRETENEINLLVPGGGDLYDSSAGAPAWSFGPPSTAGEHEDEGDEMGDSVGAGSAKGKARR